MTYICSCILGEKENDQYREGSWVLVARSRTFCPVSLIEKFLFKGGHKSDSHLFREICCTKGWFLPISLKLFYTRVLEKVRALLKSIDLDPLNYSFHSMRS